MRKVKQGSKRLAAFFRRGSRSSSSLLPANSATDLIARPATADIPSTSPSGDEVINTTCSTRPRHTTTPPAIPAKPYTPETGEYSTPVITVATNIHLNPPFPGASLPPIPLTQVPTPSAFLTPNLPPNPTPFAPFTIPTTASLWKDAFNTLSPDEQLYLAPQSSSHHTVLAHVLNETRKQHEIYKSQRRSFSWRGKTILVSEITDRVVGWAERFAKIGDVVVQYEPGYLALPWAGLRLLLQVAVNQKETLGAVVVGIEKIAHTLLRCRIYERLYIDTDQRPDVYQHLREQLVGLYVDILAVLVRSRCFLEGGEAAPVLAGLLETGALKEQLEAIERSSTAIALTATTAESECRAFGARMMEDMVGGLDTDVEELKATLKALDKSVTSADAAIAVVYKILEERERDTIIDWLFDVDYVEHHEAAQCGILERTGEWLRAKEEFTRWEESEESSILWLHGIPGAGKTKLTSMVIAHLLQAGISKTDDEYEPVAYFYCSRGEPKRRDPKIILRTIVKQLAVRGKALRQQLIAKFEERKKEGSRRGLQVAESSKLISELVGEHSRTTVIIDALDEADPSTRGELLDALESIVRTSGGLLKIFVSSRDDDDITRRLGGLPNLYIQATDNSNDIEIFVRREVASVIDRGKLKCYVSPLLRQRIESTLINGAQGMFLWVDLQIKSLCDLMFAVDIEEALGRLPESLEATYVEIFHKIESQKGQYGRTLGKRALNWLSCFVVPPTPEMWVAAVCSPRTRGKATICEVTVESLLDACRNMVFWDSQRNVMRFAHLSVREFLEKNESTSPALANMKAAKSCLTFLENPAYWLGGAGIYTIPFGFYLHVISHWGIHVMACLKTPDSAILARLPSFLEGKAYMEWIKSSENLLYDHLTITGSLEYALINLRSYPLNPLFAYCLLGVEEPFKTTPDMTCVNEAGKSLLYIACQEGHVSIVRTLLERGLAVNEGKDKYLKTPLIAAIGRGHSEIVEVLLKHGAKMAPNADDLTGVFNAIVNIGTPAMLVRELQHHGDQEIDYSIIRLAATNCHHSNAMLQTFLKHLGERAVPAILKAAVSDCTCAREILTLLFAEYPHIEVTEDLLSLAIAYVPGVPKDTCALDILLRRVTNLSHRIFEVAMTYVTRKRLAALLSTECNIRITEDVFRRVSGWITDPELLASLLTKAQPITQMMVERSVCLLEGERLLKLIQASDCAIVVTEELLAAAARRSYILLEYLLAMEPNVPITNAILKAAASNPDGKACLELLLVSEGEKYLGPDILLEAVGRRDVMEYILERSSSIAITEAILLAAVYFPECISYLLSHPGHLEVTEHLIATVVTNANRDIVEALLSRAPDVTLTERIIESALTNPDPTVSELLLAKSLVGDAIQRPDADHGRRLDPAGAQNPDPQFKDPKTPDLPPLVVASTPTSSLELLRSILSGPPYGVSYGATIPLPPYLVPVSASVVWHAKKLAADLTEPDFYACAKILNDQQLRYLLTQNTNITFSDITFERVCMTFGPMSLQYLLSTTAVFQFSDKIFSATDVLTKLSSILIGPFKVTITEKILREVIALGNQHLLNLVIAETDPSIVTEDFVKEVLKLVFRTRGLDYVAACKALLSRLGLKEIPEESLVIAGERGLKEVFNLALHLDSTITFSEAVLDATAGPATDHDLLSLVFSHSGNARISQRFLRAIAARGDGKSLELALAHPHGPPVDSSMLLDAVSYSNLEILPHLLLQLGFVQISHSVFVAAAKNGDVEAFELLFTHHSSTPSSEDLCTIILQYGNIDLLNMFFDHAGSIEITGFLLKAAIKSKRDEEFLRCILERSGIVTFARPGDIGLFELALKTVFKFGNLNMMRYLFSQLDTPTVTGAGLEALVARNALDGGTGMLYHALSLPGCARIKAEHLRIAATSTGSIDILYVLLSKPGVIDELDESVWDAAARGGNMRGLELLATLAKIIAMTEYVLQAALLSVQDSHHNLLKLFADRTERVIITKRAFSLAFGYKRVDVVQFVLNLPRSPEVSEADLKRAIRSGSAEVVQLLLSQPRQIPISENMLRCAVLSRSADVVQLLLDHLHPCSTGVTENMLISAAETYEPDVLQVLLSQAPSSVITESVFVAAARSVRPQLLQVLLDLDNGIYNSSRVTERVLASAARCGSRAVLQRALAAKPNSVVGETVLVSAAKSGQRDLVEHLLTEYHDLEVSEEVLEAAATEWVDSTRCGSHAVLERALTAEPYAIKDDAVLSSAALSGRSDLFLRKWIDCVRYEEYWKLQGLQAAGEAFNNSLSALQYLLTRKSSPVTERVVEAISRRRGAVWGTLSLVLPHFDSSEISLSLRSAFLRSGWVSAMEELHRKFGSTVICELTLKAAAATSKKYGSHMLHLLLSSDEPVELEAVSEELARALLSADLAKGDWSKLLRESQGDSDMYIEPGVFRTVASKGRWDLIELFLANGYSVPQEIETDGSYLQAAVEGGLTSGVEHYLRTGLTLTIDEHGWTPLMVAKHCGYGELVTLLEGVEFGAGVSAKRPNKWDFKGPHESVTITNDWKDITCSEMECKLVFPSNNPIPPGPPEWAYFEIELLCLPDEGEVSYGFGGDYRFTLPGEEDVMWFRTSNGTIHLDRDLMGRYGGPEIVNDTVGCGIDWKKRVIFFTRSGTRLDLELPPLEWKVQYRLYPIVIIEVEVGTAQISANFAGPFQYKFPS